jgi:Sulfotransferase family
MEILAVSAFAEQADGLVGGALDLPKPGARAPGHALELAGWALTPEGPPEQIRIASRPAEGDPGAFAGTLLDLDRPFNSTAAGGQDGFHTSVSLIGLPRDFEIEVSAIDSGGALPFGRVTGRRAPLEGASGEDLRPILIEAPGRSGSTWTMTLLGCHPDVVVYAPFRVEPRLAGYWTELFRAVSEPATFMRAVRPELLDYSPDWWSRRGSRPPVDVPEPALARWLLEDSVEDLAAFCRRRIDGFYRRAAEAQGKPAASCFAERGTGARAIAILQELYPRLAEIFLIRDPRDMLASRFAADTRLGRRRFNRDEASSDADYVRTVYAQQLRRHLRRWRSSPSRQPMIRYEDLIQTPKPALAELFGHLGLDDREETVGQVLETAAVERANRQRAHMTATGPQESIGRWRRDLSPEVKQACEESLGGLIGDLGY